jgi:hypothetical protein
VSDDGRIPLSVVARESDPAEERGVALILTSGKTKPFAHRVIRHADAAAVEQSGHCQCCRVPSDLVTVLRQLFLDRIRGEVEFDRVAVQAPPDLVEAALRDPLVGARYRRVNGFSPLPRRRGVHP